MLQSGEIMLSDAQIVSIVKYLGYPYLSWSLGMIRRRAEYIAAQPESTEIESVITDVLSKLDDVENTRLTSLPLAGKQITGTTGDAYFQGAIQPELDSQYNYYRRKLSVYVDIPFYSNLFVVTAISNPIVRG